MPELNAPDSSPVPPGGPSAAPMGNPTPHEGLKAQAVQGVQLAIKLLESTLLAFGSQSPEGKKVLSAINSLGKLGGPPSGADMNQAEVKMLNAKVSPENIGGGAPPMPPPGGAPGGMPMGGPMPRGI